MKERARRAPAAERAGAGSGASAAQYSAPRYYEIAFDMNRKQEVDFLAHCFRTYARKPVRTVLDIACGTGPHLIRLARLGYRMTGLDLSHENIDFLRGRARAHGLAVNLVVGDMTRFRLARPVDAAICMQDSQGHLLTNEAITAHLRCVAGALRPGGLYVFDRYMCSSWVDPARRWSWTRRRGRATVRATFETLRDLNPVTQTFFEDMELDIVDGDAHHVYRQRHASRMVFPQELRSLVALAGGFEVVEWFYGFKPHLRLDRAHHPLLMVVVLRRT
ncbi:MAG TPA: class I SAM-dependent methyltransferase [Candidatus Binatia bacterium]|nr:class I SAM-dependent methyltransferase [Candidatus Binatia bacterium]